MLLSPPEAPEVSAPSSGSAPEVGQNPFNRYGDIAIVTNILTRIMNSDSKRAELASSQGVAGYDIVASPNGRDPVFEVTGHGPDAPAAVAAADVVLAEASNSLAKVQQAQRADPDYFITSAPLEPPSEATAVYGSTMRMGIAVLAFGGLCTLGVAVLAEVIARRRADRRTASHPAGVTSASTGSNGHSEEGSQAVVAAGEVVEATGSNGHGEEGSGAVVAAGEVVEATGSNGHGEEGSGAVVAAGEVVEAAGSNRSTEEDPAAPGEVVEPTGSAGSDGSDGSDGSFDSIGLVPESARQRVKDQGSSRSPAWGRPPAPLGRRPHRWSPPPNRSKRASGDDGGTQPTADH